ncbi:lactate permease LctP family transporter [Polycladomyces subterraneus]|uniref:L-lactate permease n=1 Tax=Polycladomyces subterraneus TaxID=1016997 RepID=A0ABT8IP15_9BACL|nr:lactate permease LctP family transporter [Polycladomyces subterraneus]MDN4594534.1 lactate permease LctP family transporter [Polycladomyces subterraneus]
MWHQIYNPLAGSVWMSTLAAGLPILYFFWALAFRRTKGHIAGLITVVLALLISVLVYKMPVKMSVLSFVYGGAVGLFPIGWIIVTAVFLYKITVKTGKFDIIRASVTNLTDDHRLQALLIAFCFGAFLEGCAGFGTPVVITAALLAGLGFRPLYAAGICLIANTAPVAFGAIGIPITVAGTISGLDPFKISQMVGRQLPLLSIFVPFWLVFVMCGWKKTREVMPAIFVTGGTFAIVQFLSSNFLGPELPDILSSLICLLVLSFFLRIWKPKQTFRFDSITNQTKATATEVAAATEVYSTGQILLAWSPFILLTGFIVLWSIPAVKNFLNQWTFKWSVPVLHQMVLKMPPIVTKPTPYDAVFTFDWLAAVGTAILIASFFSMFLVGMRFKTWLYTFGETLVELRYPLLTIFSVLGLAYIFNYSGMSATLGLALAKTGVLFPFFAPVLGWLGVFLSGSDTSSNALFGNLQKITANQIGINPVLTVAANSSGGVTGKMISPQSIAVATASTGLVGKESDLFRFTIKHSLFLVLIICAITLLQAYVLKWMIP